MGYFPRDGDRDAAPALARLRHVGAKCGVIVLVVASLPILLLALPILLLTERNVKDGEYWD
jgi:hypothetical protein